MKFHVLFTLLFTISACAFASDTTEKPLLSLIISEQPESVQEIREGKLYLNPENVVASSDGLALVSGLSNIPLSTLSSDQNGCFLAFSPSDSMIVTCWNCNYVFDLNELVTSCPKCGYGE
jgi:hypothetical protein